MKIIDYASTFRVLHEYVEAYNHHAVKPLKSAMILTAQEVLKIYGATLTAAHKKNELESRFLPPLKTNNKQLAKRTQSSSRTIQRHLKRLEEAGIITEKIFHGRKQNYALFINEKILFITPNIAINKLKTLPDKQKKQPIQTAENQSNEKIKETKCPPSELNRLNNNLLIDVHKKNVEEIGKEDKAACREGASSGNRPREIAEFMTSESRLNIPQKAGKKKKRLGKIAFAGNEPKAIGNIIASSRLQQPKNNEEDYDKQKIKATSEKTIVSLETNGEERKKINYPGGGENFEKVMNNPVENSAWERRKRRQRSPAETAAERCTSLKFYTGMLWSLMREVLYKDVHLTDRQVEIAERLLYQWYEPVVTSKLLKVHQIYVERVSLVRKYLEKDPKRFVQFPDRYLDPKNPHGFAGTKKWHHIHKKRQNKIALWAKVKTQIRRFKRNEMLDSTKRKPPISLFKECQRKVAQLRDKELLDHFNREIIHYIIPEPQSVLI